MAAADYRLCDVCGCKTFYDANLDYDMKEYPGSGLFNVGDWAVICRKCVKTHEVRVVELQPGPAESESDEHG